MYKRRGFDRYLIKNQFHSKSQSNYTDYFSVLSIRTLCLPVSYKPHLYIMTTEIKFGRKPFTR